MSFYDPKTGMHTIDIIPFKAGKGNPYADPGQLHFERTFFAYRNIGAEELWYVCSSKTFGEPDYIQEYRQREARNENADPDHLKALAPKERQLFLVFDHDERDKGIQLWESSFHTFGKLLLERIKKSPEERGWDLFYYPDEDGFTLEITVSEKNAGTFSFNEVSAIDFIPRKKALPDDLVNHGFCPDDMLVKTPYNKLKNIFLGVPDDTGDDSEGTRDDRSESRRSDDAEKPRGEERPAEKPKAKTAHELGYKRDSEVSYKGRKHTVLKVSDDGMLLTLMDQDDEVVPKIDVESVFPWKSAAPAGSNGDTKKPDADPPKERAADPKPESKGDGKDKWDDWN